MESTNKNYYAIGATGLEANDVMSACVKDPVSAWHYAALKYLLRANKKHDTPYSDFKKAHDYLGYILKELESELSSEPIELDTDQCVPTAPTSMSDELVVKYGSALYTVKTTTKESVDKADKKRWYEYLPSWRLENK